MRTMLDAIAAEPQFIDHLAPVWRLLPDRGRFLVLPELIPHAASRGVQAEPARFIRQPSKASPNASGPTALVASYGDIKKGRRLGYGSFVFLEHGIGQSYSNRHGSYSGGSDRDDVRLFLVPNEHVAARWRQFYPQAQVAVVGCPKLDDTPVYEPTDPSLVALSFHWECRIAPEAAGAFGFYRRSVPELAKAYSLLGHGHPRMLPILSRYYTHWGIEIVRDFADVLRRAAVYVCDNSSTLYEFAATGRPVVVLNHPSYRKDVSHGLRFWDAAKVGIQVDDPADLSGAIATALQDAEPLPTNREQALDVVYAYRSGAARRAVDAIAALDRRQEKYVA